MIVTNVRYYENIDFDDYLALPGFSYSWLKSEGEVIEETPKMKVGTHVHKYLLTNSELTSPSPGSIRAAAMSLKNTIGPGLLRAAKPELTVTADFEYEGLIMPYKGRIDLPIIPKMIIDIKVSEMQIDKAIEYFGYDRQVSGYSLATGCPLGFVVAVHPKKLISEVRRIPITKTWWQGKVIQYGKPAREAA